MKRLVALAALAALCAGCKPEAQLAPMSAAQYQVAVSALKHSVAAHHLTLDEARASLEVLDDRRRLCLERYGD